MGTTIMEQIGNLASFIGSLTVVGGALIWIYNKFIGEPREKKRSREAKKRQEEMIIAINKENEPLSKSIKELRDMIEDSIRDREQLHSFSKDTSEKVEEHEKRLDDHGDRLIVLETKNGIKRVNYKEEYK